MVNQSLPIDIFFSIEFFMLQKEVKLKRNEVCDMQRKGKTSFMKAKSKLLCYLLSGALLSGNLITFQTVSASAEEVTELSNENQETLQPQIIVRNYKELAQAIDEAGDGDVIGIDNIIELNSDVNVLGDSEKRLTICKMSEDSYIVANLSADVRVENIIFDGRGVAFDRCYMPMFKVEGKVDFNNVTFQNCYNNWSGGAIIANGGEMNITRCYFKNNRASEGGHIVIQSAKVSVQNSVFENGIAENGGGAVKVELNYNYENGIEFDNCKIIGNQAQFGGAIANKGSVKITNSVIYSNQAKIAADFINYMDSSFQIDSIEEMIELYKNVGIIPVEWIYDYDNKSYINGEIEKDNPNAALKLVYEEIPDEKNPDEAGDSGTGDSSDDNNSQNEDKKDESDSENGGSGKDESKGDATDSEQPKDDGNKEDNNGNNSATDNKDNTNENNTGDSNSEQSKPEGGTANTDSNTSNDDKENQNNQDKQDNVGNNENNSSSSSDLDNKDSGNGNVHTPDNSTGNGNQTSNPRVEKPATGNSSSASDSTTPSSEGNKQPDGTVNNGNQGGASVGNTGNNGNNNNQNPSNKPVSGSTNNTTNGNVSDNTSSGSGSDTGNSNINTDASQNGGNVSPKPEDGKDTVPSDKQNVTTITDSSQTSASDTNKDDSGNKNNVTKKKSIKKLTVTAKKGKRKIIGKTIKKATVKVKIGKQIYKVKANSKGKFTVKLKGKTKLKKGQKIKITVSKKGYKTRIKTVKVK